MTAVNGKTCLVLSMILALAWCQQSFPSFTTDGEVPAVLSYNSPLRKPDSLRSRPYFDFLSTLYRRDVDKNQLFSPYLRTRREAVDTNAIFLVLSMLLAFAWCQQNYRSLVSDSVVPAVLSYNSPLRKPNSLTSQPYFDFLSTLYSRDADKSQLFRPYIRTRREAVVSRPINKKEHHERSWIPTAARPIFI